MRKQNNEIAAGLPSSRTRVETKQAWRSGISQKLSRARSLARRAATKAEAFRAEMWKRHTAPFVMVPFPIVSNSD